MIKHIISYTAKTTILLVFICGLVTDVTSQTETPALANHFAGNRIPIPPAVHPRLFVTKEMIPSLKNNLNAESLRPIWKRVQDLSNSGRVPALQKAESRDKPNFDPEPIRMIQAHALVYLFEGQKARGRAAIDMMNSFFNDVVFPEKLDITRRIGETITTGAIVYDWCYDLMSKEERMLFIRHFKKLAASMEIGYPPVKQGSVTGHGSEAQVMRDLLSAGIAVYDEDKEMYNLAATTFFEDFVPIRNYWYKSHTHHQGDSYGPYRLQWELFAAMIYGRMGYKNIFSKDQAQVPYRWVYTRRPDGQLLRDGDSFIAAQTRLGVYWSSPFHLMLASNYYKDSHLKYEFEKQYALTLSRYGIDDIWILLFNDPAVKGVVNAKLPLAKYYDDPSAGIVARTAWDTGINASAVVAEMKIGGLWFANHQHLDAGHFQIYYKGGLAIDAGIYEGTKGAYGSVHDNNFHKRSIAHNTMLVFDSTETFLRSRNKVSNDGGQRIPNLGYEAVRGEDLFSKGYRVAHVLRHEIGPDAVKPAFSYIKGDISKAYTKKVSDYTRSFVFLDLQRSDIPAAMIVYDRITSSDANHRKTWLLHSMQEPEISGHHSTILRTEHGYSGKLVNTTLLPKKENVLITKVGGPGKEFEVNGVNYEQYVNRPNSSEEAGAWRLEISPAKAAKTDHFLNVLQVMDYAKGTNPIAAEMIETPVWYGVTISDRMVMFSKTGKPVSGKLSFTIKGKAGNRVKVLVTDLKGGSWVLKQSGTIQHTQRLSEESGTFYFEGLPGLYTLEPR